MILSSWKKQANWAYDFSNSRKSRSFRKYLGTVRMSQPVKNRRRPNADLSIPTKAMTCMLAVLLFSVFQRAHREALEAAEVALVDVCIRGPKAWFCLSCDWIDRRRPNADPWVPI